MVVADLWIVNVWVDSPFEDADIVARLQGFAIGSSGKMVVLIR
jgi:hypothetical protein